MYALLGIGFCILFYVVVYLNQNNIDLKDKIEAMETKDPQKIQNRLEEEGKRAIEREKKANQKIVDDLGL